MKLIIYFFIFVILVSSATATLQTLNDSIYAVTLLTGSGITDGDNGMNISSTLEQLGIGNYTQGGYGIDIGILYLLLQEEEVAPVSGVGGSWYRKKAVALYYDVIVDVEKDRYKTNEIVRAKITIINKGYEPDRDGVLYTYMEAPDGTRYREHQMEFELIPPTCLQGSYDYILEKCVWGNNITADPHVYILWRNMTIQEDGGIGEWKFYGEYETRVQPLIIVFDSFEVIGIKNYFWFMLLGFALLVFYLEREYGKVGKSWVIKYVNRRLGKKKKKDEGTAAYVYAANAGRR